MNITKSLFIAALVGHVFGACTPAKKADSEVKQETDDRSTAVSSQLYNVGAVLELLVNHGIDKARVDLKLISNDIDEKKRIEFVKLVGENIGNYVKGSGVTILDIVQLTNLEITLDGMLSEEKKEKVRVPFKCSRYRDNPMGIPYISGATPANINETTANHTISSIFNLNGTLVGGDKLAHLFAVGRKMYLAKLSKEDRWKLGQFLEGHPDFPKGELLKFAKMGASIDPAWGVFGVYGSFSTGVISEADMYANEHGVRFYEKLYAEPFSYRFELKNLCEEEKGCAWYWNEQNVPNKYTSMVRVNDTEGCL